MNFGFASDVEGTLFYKLPAGDLVERQVTLSVPSRGQGEVKLYGEKFEWITENFWTETVNGETVFYAVFKTEFQQFKSTIALKGTYINATNKILYYGSMFKKDGHHDLDKNIDGLEFTGGFKFIYNR